LIFPHELELVVEDDAIRWGASSRPERQQRLSMQKLVRVIYDKSDNQVLADVGGIRLIPVADSILMREVDRSALVEYLRECFPALRIEVA
jgi:hypothetical protein